MICRNNIPSLFIFGARLHDGLTHSVDKIQRYIGVQNLSSFGYLANESSPLFEHPFLEVTNSLVVNGPVFPQYVKGAVPELKG